MREAISLVGRASIAILAAGFAAQVLAVDGATPIWDQATITQPGKYVLTRDISGSSGALLSIQASGVTVDLNGYTIEQTNPSSEAVLIAAPPTEDDPVTLQNGTIRGGSYGILSLVDDSDISLHDLAITQAAGTAVAAFALSTMEAFDVTVEGGDAGLFLTGTEAARTSVRLRDLRVRRTTDAAIRLWSVMSVEASGLIIADSKFGLDMAGLVVVGSPAVTSVLIGHSTVQADLGIRCANMTCNLYESTIQSCARAVYFSDAYGSLISNSAVLATTDCFDTDSIKSSAIRILNSAGSGIIDSIVRGSSDPGAAGERHGVFIDSSDGVSVKDSVISAHGDSGVYVSASDHVSITDTSSSFNGSHGFYTDGNGNTFDHNSSSNNGGDGLHLATAGHVFRGNLLVGNNGGVNGAGSVDSVDGGDNIETSDP